MVNLVNRIIDAELIRSLKRDIEFLERELVRNGHRLSDEYKSAIRAKINKMKATKRSIALRHC